MAKHELKFSNQFLASITLFVAFCVALGFLWAGSAFGRIIAIIILVIFLISTALSLRLFFKKRKQTRLEEEAKLRTHKERMQAITASIIAQGDIAPLREHDQRVVNHYVAFVMSQWGFRADVPDQTSGHSIDVWLYQGAQQFATWVNKDTASIETAELEQFAQKYLTHHAVRGVYITLGSFSDAARQWMTRNNLSALWLVDGEELLKIIRRTDQCVVAWDAGATAPLPNRA